MATSDDRNSDTNELAWFTDYLSSTHGQAQLEVADSAMEFTLAIERLLRARNMSRADLARLLGVDRSVITRRLKGSSDLRLSTIAEMLSALGVNLSLCFSQMAMESEQEPDLLPVSRSTGPTGSNLYKFPTGPSQYKPAQAA